MPKVQRFQASRPTLLTDYQRKACVCPKPHRDWLQHDEPRFIMLDNLETAVTDSITTIFYGRKNKYPQLPDAYPTLPRWRSGNDQSDQQESASSVQRRKPVNVIYSVLTANEPPICKCCSGTMTNEIDKLSQGSSKNLMPEKRFSLYGEAGRGHKKTVRELISSLSIQKRNNASSGIIGKKSLRSTKSKFVPKRCFRSAHPIRPQNPTSFQLLTAKQLEEILKPFKINDASDLYIRKHKRCLSEEILESCSPQKKRKCDQLRYKK